MSEIVIKKEFIKITGDIKLAIILDEIIATYKNFRKEFLENKWHCPDYFQVDFEKIVNDNMLGLSKVSIRRYIGKLSELGFISINKLDKKHTYKLNLEKINYSLKKMGFSEVILNSRKDNMVEINLEEKEDEVITIENCNLEDCKNNKDISYIERNLKEQLEYEVVKNSFDEDFIKWFDNIYNILLDVMATDNKCNIRVNKQDKPAGVVKSVLSKVNVIDIQDVVHSLKDVDNKVYNFKNYILTSLYNKMMESTFSNQNLFNTTYVSYFNY